MVCITAGVVFLCGCGQPVSVPMRICPGKQTVEQVAESMASARDKIQPIRAAGKLIYKEYLPFFLDTV